MSGNWNSATPLNLDFVSLVGSMNEIPGNYGHPNASLFIGDQWSAVSDPQLQKHRITHLLNMTPVQVPQKPGIIYHQIPMQDEPSQELLLLPALQFIDEVLSQGGRILIFCQAGRSRSAATLIGYLMAKYGISYSEAYRIVKEKRPLIEPNEGFVYQLKEFENLSN